MSAQNLQAVQSIQSNGKTIFSIFEFHTGCAGLTDLFQQKQTLLNTRCK
jgi:hypothetical protein